LGLVLCAYGGCISASLGHLYEHKADGAVVEGQSKIILNVAEVSVRKLTKMFRNGINRVDVTHTDNGDRKSAQAILIAPI